MTLATTSTVMHTVIIIRDSDDRRGNELRLAGYRVIEATDEDEAFRLAEAEQPALVLLPALGSERARILAENTPALIWVNGPDGCEFVNREYVRFLGVQDQEVRGYDWAQFVHPDDREAYVDAYLNAAADRRLFEATFRFRRHDGVYRWMKSIGAPRFGAAGEFLGYVGSTVDISDIHVSQQIALRTGISKPFRQVVKEYALALGITLAALLARFALDPFLGDHLPYATFLVAVAISTWYAGLGPSLTSMVLGGVAADWFFMSPRHSLLVVGVVQQVGYLTYFTMCLALVGFGHAARRARQQSEHVMDGLRREVVERERAEEALRDSLLQYQSTFDNAAVGMSHVALDGRWLKVNDRLCDITGYSRDELLAGKFGDITHPQDLEADWAQARRLVAGDIATYSMEKRYLHKTGSIVWVHLTVSLVRDAEGRPKHFISIINDITERKLAEEELARAKRRTETILESAGEAVFGLSADGLSTFINPAAAEMFGYRVDELLGRNTHDILHHSHSDGRDYPVRDCPIYASLTDGNMHRADDEVFWHKDGRAIAVSYTSTPLWDGNRLSGAVVVLRDITARKQAEKALRESEERLRSLAGQLEQLVEERTEELVQSQERLRALATELNLAEQRERKRLASDLHDHLAQMLVLAKLQLSQLRQVPELTPKCVSQIEQTEDVLGQSLTYTRTLVADLAPPVLHDLGFQAAIKWLSEQMRRYHLAVRADLDEEDEFTLPEDEAVLLFQSVRELLINTVKHAHVGEATVSSTRRNGVLRIEVRDKGKGFVKAPLSDTTSSQFGLFSIKERMKALGGTFDVESIPNHGTVATLTLPIKDGPASSAQAREHDLTGLSEEAAASKLPAPAPEMSHQPPDRTRVLLVDDHAMVRQGLRSVLETYADIEIVGEAWNGEDAVALVEQLQPAIVLMDINMPIMNGIEATARIKARSPHIAVIGLSVQTGPEALAAMMEAGALTLLTKEAAVDHLHRTIQQAKSRTLPTK